MINTINKLIYKVTEIDKDNMNLNNSVNELRNDNLELSDKVAELTNNNTALIKDNINLNNQIKKINDDNLKLNDKVTELNNNNTTLIKDNINLNNQIKIISDDNLKLNNKVTELTKNNINLNNQIKIISDENLTLKTEVKKLNNNLDFSNRTIGQLSNEVQELKKKVNNRDFTINQKEQEIKRQKAEIISSSKEKKDLLNINRELGVKKATLEISLKKKNNDYIELNKKQLNLKNENETINNKNIELEKLNEELKKNEYEKILIGARDFLKLIINDLCYYFDVESCDEYTKMAESLIKAINNNTEIKLFIKNVELINFLILLGNVIDEMEQNSHKLFPELSFKYRNDEYNKSEEEVRENIKLCMKTFGNYVNKNFDLLTKFFNEYYDYPKYAKVNKNNIKGKNKYFFDAVKKYEKENNIPSDESSE